MTQPAIMRPATGLKPVEVRILRAVWRLSRRTGATTYRAVSTEAGYLGETAAGFRITRRLVPTAWLEFSGQATLRPGPGFAALGKDGTCYEWVDAEVQA